MTDDNRTHTICGACGGDCGPTGRDYPTPNGTTGAHESHTLKKCTCGQTGCMYCDGGLAFCTVCAGGEADLSESCLSRVVKQRDTIKAELDQKAKELKHVQFLLAHLTPHFDALETEAKALKALLQRLRANHPNNDPGYGVSQMASGKETQDMWGEVDAVLGKKANP